MKRLYIILTFALIVSCTKEKTENNTIEEPLFSKCIYLDFDGEKTYYGQELNLAGSGLNNSDINTVLEVVQSKFSAFKVTVTKTRAIYENFQVGNRQMAIITTTSDWYGGTGAGTAIVNSFGTETPVFVFPQYANDYPPTIGKAICHELGHSLGLYHQSKYNTDCSKGNEYREGCIMGLYYGNSSWAIGQSSLGCDSIQNDVQIISETLKLK